MSKKQASMRDVIARTSKSVRSGPPALRRANQGSWSGRSNVTGRSMASSTGTTKTKKTSS